MGIITEMPQKIESRAAPRPNTPGYTSKGDTIVRGRDIYSPMFIAAVFTTARKWKQAKCPPI
jgi:hypothetical protein